MTAGGGTHQLTLVALYGERSAALQALIEECVGEIGTSCGKRFVPYAMDQLHATVIGLETEVVGGVRVHRNLLEHHDCRDPFDLEGYRAELERTLGRLDIRFGGFAPRAEPFTSRGRTPWERSFSIQGDKAVLIGWPVADGPPERYPDTLDTVRRAARAFGIAHAYHREPTDRDNDLYLRLGIFRDPPPADARAALERRVRERLAANAPVVVRLAARDLRVVAYDAPELPPETTTAIPLLGSDLSHARLNVLLGCDDRSALDSRP